VLLWLLLHTWIVLLLLLLHTWVEVRVFLLAIVATGYGMRVVVTIGA